MEGTTLPGRLTWQLGEVVATQTETERARSLTFAMPAWPGHRPGQHVDVRLTADDGYQAERSYSIASAPQDSPNVTITVERLEGGEVSPYLVDEVRSGDRLELRGPIGGYFVWESQMGGPLLLAGGGSGIVPLMAMVRHRRAVDSMVPARLLYSSRSHDELIYRAELDALASHNALEVIYTFTRSQPPGWTGYRRRIDQALLREVIWPAQDRPLAYICGPTQFVETAASVLAALGYEADRIRTERFGPTGGG